MDCDAPNRPRGFVAIGAFFVFGATMAAYAAVILPKPGTLLDALWVLNRRGHAGLVCWAEVRYFYSLSSPRSWDWPP